MNNDALIFYLCRLIKDGHKWQYTNINGKCHKPVLYFTFLQLFAIFISIWFVFSNPTGLSSTAKEYIINCLSILVALFLSLLLLIFDKSKQISTETSSVRRLQRWNFFYQFNALTSYAILLSILDIILIVVGIIFNINCDLSKYHFVPYSQWNFTSIIDFIKCSFVAISRGFVVYFFIDFFIICFYAVCSIYQFTSVDLLNRKVDICVYNEEDIKISFKREFGFNILRIKIFVSFIFVVALCCIISRYWFT